MFENKAFGYFKRHTKSVEVVKNLNVQRLTFVVTDEVRYM